MALTLLKLLALAPVIAPQGLWVAARAARLPEASGDRMGKAGHGPALRLLVLGDSSAAGVGVATQSEALGGRLAARLAARFSVQWQVVARCGGTVRSTMRLVDELPSQPFDAVIVALGVNDTKNGVSLKSWTGGYRALLDQIADRFGPGCICVSGLPPLGEFPVLPAPLSRVLGERAHLFDTHLRVIAAGRADTAYLPLDFPMDVTQMASDGFHPGPDVYDAWAARAAELFTEKLSPKLE